MPYRLPDVLRIDEQTLALDGNARAAHLDAACGGDADLRREVEALLAEHSSPAGNLLDTPAGMPPALEAGRRLGPYEVLGLLGAGGMGAVYKARDTRLTRTVAIKIVAGAAALDQAARERFTREALAIAALNHPHICTLYDVGRDGATDYLVMEHLEGETLATRLKKGPLPLVQAAAIGTAIADALAAAHRQGVVHRDLKPANVMLTTTGGGRRDAPQVKLLDFGLAKLVRRPGVTAVGPSAISALETVTMPGAVMGTVPYMAPEQLEGKEVDPRSDIFSFGAVLYEMVTGKRAFRGDSSASVISAILSSQPPALSSLQPATPPALDRLVQRCLAKDPDGRWQTATDSDGGTPVAVNLLRVGSAIVVHPGRWSESRRRWAWFAAAALLLAVAGTAGWWTNGTRPAPVERYRARHTQVTFSGDVRNAALAPDGRTIAYAMADGHDVAQSGPSRALVRDIQIPRPSRSGAVTRRLFPRGCRMGNRF